MLKNRDLFWILLIILLGLVFRLIGITHSFPYIFHPDEPTIVRSALGVRFYLNPGHFDWPHLYIYLNYFLYMAFAFLRNLLSSSALYNLSVLHTPIIWDDTLIFYLITRVSTALFGAFTAIPLYLTGKKVFGSFTGLMCALAISVTPFHVWYSHYSLADVPMVFFLCWSLYFSTELFFSGKIKHYILAGFFAGLSASTKYNGGFSIIFIIFAYLARVWIKREEKLVSYKSCWYMLVSGVVALLSFLIGTPFALLDRSTFLSTKNAKGAMWQFTNVGSVGFDVQIRTFLHKLFIDLPDNFGYSLFFLFLLSIVYSCYRAMKAKSLSRRPMQNYFGFISLLGIFYVSGFEKSRAHYFFIVYGVVLLSAVGFLSEWLEKYRFKYKYCIWFVVYIVPFVLSLWGSYTFSRKDTRILLGEWLMTGSEKYSSISYDSSELRPVFEKLPVGAKKVSDNYYPYSKGDILITTRRLVNESVKVEYFSNRLRRGPELFVYEGILRDN